MRPSFASTRLRLLLGFIAASGASACIFVSDFDHERGSGGSGGVSASTGASTASGTSSSTGADGAGGAGGCDADLTSDEQNCGACGFVCDDEMCVDGACGQCIDLSSLGQSVRSVVVDEDLVYLVQEDFGSGGGAPGGQVRTLPLAFASDTAPGLGHAVENGVTNATLGTVGDHHVYVAGQVSRVIYACSPTGCLAFDIEDFQPNPPILSQVNGMAPTSDALFFVEGGNLNRLLRVSIDQTTGLPNGTPANQVSTYDPPIPSEPENAGVLGLGQALTPTHLFWSSYDYQGVEDGCIYRVSLAELPFPLSPGLPCYSPVFKTQGFVVAPDGVVFAYDAPNTVQKIEGTPAVMTAFDTNATTPFAVDDAYLYVKDVTSGGVRAIPRAGGSSVTSFTQPPASLDLLDARHPRYVVGGVGTHVCRWPKPTSN